MTSRLRPSTSRRTAIRRDRGICPPRPRAEPPPANVDEIVDRFIADIRPRVTEENRFYSEQPTIEEVIRAAATGATREGTMHDHQRRIGYRALNEFAALLLECKAAIAQARTFDALHAVIAGAAPRGVGALAVYDTAERIGIWRGIQPRRVYLHAGTMQGARALGIRGVKEVEVKDLPKAFRRLDPGEVESCLCIYHRDIARIAARDGLRVTNAATAARRRPRSAPRGRAGR